MATVRQPSMRGVSAAEIPFGQVDNKTRADLGLPQQLDDDARKFGAQTRERVSQLKSTSTSAPITSGAQPTGAVPSQPTTSKMSSISQRASGAIRSLLPRGAAPTTTPAAPAASRGMGVRGAAGALVAGTAGFAAGQGLTERREIPVAERQRREDLINQIPGQDGPALPYREAEFEPSRIERFGSDLADNVSRALPALPMAAGANVFRASTAGAAAARPVVGAIRSAPASVRAAGGAALTGAGLGAGSALLGQEEAVATAPRAPVAPTATEAAGPPESARNPDFSSALASVPRDLPAGLTDNTIYRTTDANGRTVYSGRNVVEGAQMVDGMGRVAPSRGTVSTVPGMSRDEIDRTLQRGRYAVPESSPGGSQPAGGFVASGGLLDTPKARRAAEALRQGSEQLANQRRGQDMTLQGTMAEIGDRRAARGEKAAQAAAQQARRAAFMRAAGGNPALASQIALEQGFAEDAESFSGRADADDSRAKTRNDAIQNFLKPLSTDDEGVDETLLQRNTALLQSLAPEMGYASVQELISDAPAARAAIQLINGINSTRKNTIGRVVGLDSAPTMTQLPGMSGATDESVGFIRGALTPNVSWGDRRIQWGADPATGQKAGQVFIPQEVWENEDVQRFFRARTGQ